MCRSCGAIVGAGESQCAVCGASTAAQPAGELREPPADKETVRFARAVLNRPYKFTIAFLVLNLFVFLLMWESSGVGLAVLQRGFTQQVLIAYGAKVNYLIDPPYNQWWRFVTPMFVHVDILHLLMNMFSLLILGPFVEKLYGSAKFVVFWVVTGIAGTVGSYLTFRPNLARGTLGTFIFTGTDVPAAGASGALFGLVGVLFVFGIKYRHELPEGFKRVFGTGMLPIILINLFIGFIGRAFIGNSAHLSGLFAGAALALVIDYRRPGARAGITAMWRVLQALSLAVIAVGVYGVAKNFNRPALAAPRPAQNANALIFMNYVNAMTQVQEKVSAVIHNKDLTDVQVVADRAMQAPVPDARAAELRQRLLDILSRQTTAAAASSPLPDQAKQTDQKLADEFGQWRKEYDEWLKGAFKTYTAGVTILKSFQE